MEVDRVGRIEGPCNGHKGKGNCKGNYITCWFCEKSGHMQQDCRAYLKSLGKGKGKEDEGKATGKKGKEKPSGKGLQCTGCGKPGHTVDKCWWKDKIVGGVAAEEPAKKVERIVEVSEGEENDTPWCLKIEEVTQAEANNLGNIIGMISDIELAKVLEEKGYTLLSVDSGSDEHAANNDFGDDSGNSGDTTTKLQTVTSSGIYVWGKRVVEFDLGGVVKAKAEFVRGNVGRPIMSAGKFRAAGRGDPPRVQQLLHDPHTQQEEGPADHPQEQLLCSSQG